jgi:hypothetical protein
MAEKQSQRSIVIDTESGKKNPKIVRTLVIGGVIVLILTINYFGVIKPILNALGLTKSKEDREGDRDEDRLSRSQVLSPNFYRANRTKISISSGTANESAVNIYNAKGYIYDDETLAVGSITRAGSLVNVSYISDTFNRLYGKSLQSYLSSFLESENWTEIDDFIKKTKNF